MRYIILFSLLCISLSCVACSRSDTPAMGKGSGEKEEIARLQSKVTRQAEMITQLRGVIADPAELDRVRRLGVHSADRHRCLNNLKQISSAKQQWVLTTATEPGATVTAHDLDKYISGGFKGISCSAGGVYHIQKAGMPPLCSIHGTR